ncbi:hypothetical protein HPB50_016280 [Hyalomma asiaticum]|uniref:Uncharacterized protein n=1 Tax=Hyalomma asiaticum TaxID=266040 RepID=A0ACB7SEF1_HYAAI|nr:hypothetical protein HPB50_016280 [Hyalomma asiaticum]
MVCLQCELRAFPVLLHSIQLVGALPRRSVGRCHCESTPRAPYEREVGTVAVAVFSEPPEQNDPKPQVVNLSHEPVDNLAEKPQVLFGSEREPAKNLDEKPQVVNPDLDPVGNYKEKPNTLKATYPDTSTKIQERPQVPPRVPLPARPYGERDPVPQIPVPPSQSTISNAHRPPYGGNKRCFYKSERYEHGDSVETPEPCLNCTCQKGVLVCYLRVCPTIGTPAPGCFTAREAGQCCPNVFCSGDKKSETTTTPPPPTDDDYYDYPATIDYDAETTTTTTTTTTRRPVTTSTRRYSFAPKPFKRPYDSGLEEVELSARTPSVIVEQTEQSTTAEDDVATTVTELPSTTTTTEAATQTSTEATTTRRPATTFVPTTTTRQRPAGTSFPPDDVVVTVTAMGITPTATTSLPEATTTASVGLSGSDDHDQVTLMSDPPANTPNTPQRPAQTDASIPPTRAPSTTATAMNEEARTPASPVGQASSSSNRPEVIEGGTKVAVSATTVATTTGGSTVAFTTASPFDSNEALADAGYVAGTTSPNEVAAPVRKPLTDDEPVNSVEDALHGGGRDSIMFVSSTPMPFELHHSFDLQDLNSVSGGKPRGFEDERDAIVYSAAT